jgi:hypothetical protein
MWRASGGVDLLLNFFSSAEAGIEQALLPAGNPQPLRILIDDLTVDARAVAM